MKNYINKPDILKWYIYKILLIMRLTTVILMVSMLQVSASSVAQEFTYVKKGVSLIQIFKEIKKQTGYNIIWNEKKIDVNTTIDANFKKATIHDVLNKCLGGLLLSYSINDKMVMIREKESSFRKKLADFFNSIDVRGRVVDENDAPVVGAVVKIKGTKQATSTNNNGEFLLNNVSETSILVISHLGYVTQEIKAVGNVGSVKLVLSDGKLEEVEIVSTGYQNIPKERATGSFVAIDNSQINRSVSTNILDRLDGITSGLIFTKNNSVNAPKSTIEIRGRSTLFSNAEPLIILDNFPYDGDLRNINPNDIENITVLKDAAAASAWGTRSGNGVIVITTKKGKLNSKTNVSFNSNINIGDKPDLFYTPQLSSADYIDVEQFLFNMGAYRNTLNAGHLPISPAVEIFDATKKGILSKADSLTKINALKDYDVRDQLLKYYYRTSINQQYNASISGGSNSQIYYASLGYDMNLSSDVTLKNDRITLSARNTYYLVNSKLEINTGIIYTVNKDDRNGTALSFLYPYDRFADGNGNALVVANGLRPTYAATAGNGKLLDWLYKPLDELNNSFSTNKILLTDYRLDFSVNYKILKGLKAGAYYNFEKGLSENNSLDKLESFNARSLINRSTQINATTGAVTYPVPVGGILTTRANTMTSNSGRFQVTYNSSWDKHNLDVLGGIEIKDFTNLNNANVLYGYNPDNETNQNIAINTTVNYPFFYGGGSSRIGFSPTRQGTSNRFLSYYFNGAYTYMNRYIFSVSARRDESNIFGVAANQKGVPLWSAGLAWILNNEDFYSVDRLPNLKIRATIGYTGNVNNSLSALLTADSRSGSLISAYNAPALQIVNPPNPSLKWERIKNLNLGLDFTSKNSRISGSFDFWRKTGVDLIGSSPIAPQTGISFFTGNSANTLTKGIDVILNSTNLTGTFKWYTSLLYNYSNSTVTEYKVSNGTNLNVVSKNYNNPLEGYPFYALFSFKYGGLDATGSPQGYLNNVISTNYTGIQNSINRDELVYSGSAVPTSFGNLLNTFVYKGFDLSFNLIYKFGYSFRRASLTNGNLYGITGNNYKMADYEKRWQNTGDELKTNVPALIYPVSGPRENIYSYSTVLVEKGDHIRLRDIRLSYTIGKKKHLPFSNLNLFTYANNLGILWKANKQDIDPDHIGSIPISRTIAFGLTAIF